MTNTHVERGQSLASRAINCEKHGDFQQARKLYLDAADAYARATRSSVSKELQGSYQKLTDIYLGKARILFGRQSNKLLIPSSDKFGLVIVEKDAPNPFRITPEMTAIADRCVAGKPNLEDRARAIFDWMEQNITYGQKKRGGVGYRRSDEVIKTGEGVCGEDTYPYIVMLRYSGLQARFAVVDRDCFGKKVSHACARVLSPREFSSDVAYHLFDVGKESRNGDHQEIKVITDEEAVRMFESWRR